MLTTRKVSVSNVPEYSQGTFDDTFVGPVWSVSIDKEAPNVACVENASTNWVTWSMSNVPAQDLDVGDLVRVGNYADGGYTDYGTIVERRAITALRNHVKVGTGNDQTLMTVPLRVREWDDNGLDVKVPVTSATVIHQSGTIAAGSNVATTGGTGTGLLVSYTVDSGSINAITECIDTGGNEYNDGDVVKIAGIDCFIQVTLRALQVPAISGFHVMYGKFTNSSVSVTDIQNAGAFNALTPTPIGNIIRFPRADDARGLNGEDTRGHNIPAGTTVSNFVGSTITMSANFTGTDGFYRFLVEAEPAVKREGSSAVSGFSTQVLSTKMEKGDPKNVTDLGHTGVWYAYRLNVAINATSPSSHSLLAHLNHSTAVPALDYLSMRDRDFVINGFGISHKANENRWYPLYRATRPLSEFKVRLPNDIRCIHEIKLVSFSLDDKRDAGFQNHHDYLKDDWLALHIKELSGDVISNLRGLNHAFATLCVQGTADRSQGALQVYDRSDSKNGLMRKIFPQPRRDIRDLTFSIQDRKGDPAHPGRIHLELEMLVSQD